MMRFNVGGWFLELPANFNLQLKKSNILFAFDNIELERTTSFSVPATPHNTGIFGWSNDFHYYGEKGRKRMQAQLQMDGVTKDGYLYITKYTPDAFECVFVTGELLGLADIKALGDWSQFILPSNGVSLDGAVKYADDGNDYSAARVQYKTDGEIMPSWKLASYAEMALNGAGVLVDWGDVLDKITSHRIVIGKAKGVTETPCTFTRGYLAEQTSATPYPVLNSVLMDDAGELVGVITNAQSDYPIFKVKTADAVQYYGYVQQWIARQDLTLSFADDTPDTLFLASAQMNGTFSFLGGYEFAADGTITGEPLKGREIELQTGQTFLLISQNDYLRPGVGEFEGWTIANETLTANVVVKGADEQPNNAYIRVKDNVPEMTIVELLKTCAALSGTILSYRAGEVVFVEDIAGGAFRELDKPLKWESLTRGVADYAQRNTIAFNSAEGLLSSEKIVATYAIDNVNIAEAKELFVLPFSEGQDSAGNLYIGSAFDGYTLGTWNAEKSNLYLTRVSLPLNASLQSVLQQGTSIVAEVKMTEKQFDTLKDDMVLFFEHMAWTWTSGVWSKGVAQMYLSRVSVESIQPFPPRLPLEYQEVECVLHNTSSFLNFTPESSLTSTLPSEGRIVFRCGGWGVVSSHPLTIVSFSAGAGCNADGACQGYRTGGHSAWGSAPFGNRGYYNGCLDQPDLAALPLGQVMTETVEWKINNAVSSILTNMHVSFSILNYRGEYNKLIPYYTECTTTICDGSSEGGVELLKVDVNWNNSYTNSKLFNIDKIRHGGFYEYICYDGGGNIVEHVVPCYRKSDLKVGLYYIVSGIFSGCDNIDRYTVIGSDVIYDRPWE